MPEQRHQQYAAQDHSDVWCRLTKIALASLFFVVLAARAWADTPELYLPDVLGAAGSNESYHGTGPDGRVWFARADRDFETSTLWTCWIDQSTCRDVRQAPLKASPYDAGAAFSADGRTLVFTSKRAHTSLTDAWNLWRSRWDGTRWTAPEPLASVNSATSDCCAVVAADGALFFASERDGTWDIYRAPADGQTFGAPVKLPLGVNSDGMEWPSWISRDGATLLLSSIRAGGIGGDDLYVACRSGNAWGSARNLGTDVNSPAFEDTPRVEGQYLYFGSTRGRNADTSANVYRMKVPALC